MGFPRQEYWSGVPFRTGGDLPNPGIEPTSLAFPGEFFFLFVFYFQAGVFQKGCHTKGQGTMAFSNGRRNSLPLCHLGKPHIPHTFT